MGSTSAASRAGPFQTVSHCVWCRHKSTNGGVVTEETTSAKKLVLGEKTGSCQSPEWLTWCFPSPSRPTNQICCWRGSPWLERLHQRHRGRGGCAHPANW